MFEEPVRFIEDVIRNDRSVLDLLYGELHVRESASWPSTTACPMPAGEPDDWVRVDRRRPVRARRPAADGRVPDPERPGLRTSPVKRGYWVVRRVLGETHSAAARRTCPNCRTTRRSWICRCARCWRSIATTRAAPPAMRGSIRSGWRSKATARSANARQGPGRPSGRHRGHVPRRQRGDRTRRPAAATSASIARTISSITSAASCWPTRWAGPCMLSDEPLIEQMNTKLAANGYRFDSWSRPS